MVDHGGNVQELLGGHLAATLLWLELSSPASAVRRSAAVSDSGIPKRHLLIYRGPLSIVSKPTFATTRDRQDLQKHTPLGLNTS